MELAHRTLAHKSKHSTEIFTVVSGSFNRFLPQIREAVTALSNRGIIILSPKSATPVSEINGFVILEKDKGSPTQIELNHLSAIAKSDFLYVVNPEGYIGQSVALEIGYAISHKVPIYSSERPSDEVFCNLLTSGISLGQIKSRIAKRKGRLRKTALKPSPTLADLQSYVAGVVKARGFSEEELNDVVLLLVEEIGELAKATRLETGLKLGGTYRERSISVESELADCLVYLLDLANLANVDLESALREKEALNSERKWAKHLPRLTTPLSETEMKVIKYISDGYVNKEIAFRLNVSEQTVKSLITSILRKLDANDRTQAVLTALRQGWIPLEREYFNQESLKNKK